MKRTINPVVALGCLMLTSCAPSPEEIAKKKAERYEDIAAGLNLNGHLCAEVVFASPELSSGEIQVNCKEYRDPKKSKTKSNLAVYTINTTTGVVTFVGRG